MRSYKTQTHLQTLPSLANFGGGPGPVVSVLHLTMALLGSRLLTSTCHAAKLSKSRVDLIFACCGASTPCSFESTRRERQRIPNAKQCTEASTDFGGGIYAPQNIMYAAGNRTSPPYLIATQQNGSSSNSFGSVRSAQSQTDHW